MTLSNWIELGLLVMILTALVVLRIMAKRKLDAIDGLGCVRKRRDADSETVIDL